MILLTLYLPNNETKEFRCANDLQLLGAMIIAFKDHPSWLYIEIERL